MLKRLRRAKDLSVQFCDRCRAVCTATDRADARRARIRAKALASWSRFA